MASWKSAQCIAGVVWFTLATHTGCRGDATPAVEVDVIVDTDAAPAPDVTGDTDTAPPPDIVADTDTGPEPDVNPNTDSTPEPDVEPGTETDVEPDAEPDMEPDAEPPPIRCADLSCADEGRACVESEGTADAECGDCLAGSIELAGECVEPSAAAPGDACTSDLDCPEGTWCSTVEGLERCSPRLFPGETHQMDFVFVPAGTFEQGTPDATDDERPYTATLTRNYFVSRTEVTQRQWKAATDGINPSCFQTISGSTCTADNNNDDGPVERVDWYAALAYANWLSNQHGLQPCYGLMGCTDATAGWHDGAHTGCTDATFSGLDCAGYRLLTESEWERAARGGTTTPYHWGDATDTATVGQYAWFMSNSGDRARAVGQKLANPFGLYDMSGNVWEWIWDWVALARGSDENFYPVGTATDYTGVLSGTNRGIRGGSWGNSLSRLRSSDRGGSEPVGQAGSVGIRLARSVP